MTASAFSSYLQQRLEGEWWQGPIVDAPRVAASRNFHDAFMPGIVGIATRDVPLNALDE